MDRLARFFEPLCVKQPVSLTMLLGYQRVPPEIRFPQRTSTITDVGFDVCGGYVSLLLF
jgi:hypothetical protein